MNPTDPLAGLKEVHLPPPVSLFPFAPGWWILGILCLFLLAGATFWGIRYFRSRLPRKHAIQEWKRLKNDYVLQQDSSAALRGLSMLLRRMALSTHSRTEVARLQGSDWLAFLDATGKISKRNSQQNSAFSEGVGKLLATEVYSSNASTPLIAEEMNALFDLSLEWIRSVRK